MHEIFNDHDIRFPLFSLKVIQKHDKLSDCSVQANIQTTLKVTQNIWQTFVKHILHIITNYFLRIQSQGNVLKKLSKYKTCNPYKIIALTLWDDSYSTSSRSKSLKSRWTPISWLTESMNADVSISSSSYRSHNCWIWPWNSFVEDLLFLMSLLSLIPMGIYTVIYSHIHASHLWVCH